MFLRLALASLLAVASLDAQQSVPPRGPLAIVHATVIDVVAGRHLPDYTVVMRESRLTNVGPAANVVVPPDARVVDGRGKFLIPGLIDTHIHLATSPERDSLRIPGILLAHGVTGMRDAGAGGHDQWLIALRGRVQREEILSPRLYISGMVAGRNITRYGMQDARALARQLIAWGVDGLKIRDGLTMQDVRAVVEEGTRARLPVYGHTYNFANRERPDVYTLDAAQAGVQGTMHISGIPHTGSNALPAPPNGDDWVVWWLYSTLRWLYTDAAAERSLIETMVTRGMWLEPTLVTEDWIANADTYQNTWSERGLPGSFEKTHEGWPLFSGRDLEQFRAAFARMKDFVRRFRAAGGVITAGTDCMPSCGYGLADELRLLVEAGLSPAEALRAGTSDAARALGWGDRLGRLETGLLADLVLLDDDPLKDIRNAARVRAVVANGRYLDRGVLDSLLVRGKSASPASVR
jgi:imidazolonepropionase-like amidohydrolase